MTQEAILFPVTIKAETDLIADRYVTQGGVYATPAGSGFGVTTRNETSGQFTTVSVLGTKIVTAGAAIALDAKVEIGTDGKVVTLSAGVAVGRCMQAATADGDKIEILQFLN